VRTQAEIEKLARLLGQPPARFGYLEPLGDEAIRQLREAATDRLFDADRGMFDRLAGAAAIVPDGLAATLSEKAFGPLLTARMTASVDPRKAVSVARRLPHDFLADVAAELDPRRAASVLQGLPPDHVAATSAVLAGRGDWVAMGRFVGHLTDAAIRTVVARLDDRQLVRIAHVMEDRAEAGRVARIIGERRLRSMLEIAEGEGLGDDARELLELAGIDL
jgi:hypothetical protein